MINEKTIWQISQNHPELVIEDCKKEFNLNEEQCDKLRFILMNRGVNKWLYCRLQFIKLKHEVKKTLKEYPVKSNEFRLLQIINEKMQNIAKTPRWVEWGKKVHKKMSNNLKEIKIKGRHC